MRDGAKKLMMLRKVARAYSAAEAAAQMSAAPARLKAILAKLPLQRKAASE